MGKKTLSEQDIAALASGVQLGADATADTQAEVVDVAAQTGAQGLEASVEAASAADASAQAQEAATSSGTLKFMAEQLKSAQDDLLSARVALAMAETKYNENLAVVGPLKDIAAKAVNNMRVALNGSAIDMAAMSPAQVLADYTAMSASFASKYKVGGVASVEAAQEKKPAMIDPMHKARVKAAGFNK